MITGIIFASGFSRRMGKDKLLLEVEGEKIIERVVRASKESNLDKVIIIYRKEEVKDIGEKYGLKAIYNPNASKGQSESMKLGVIKASKEHSYMFIVGDQPYLTKNIINTLINEYKKSKSTIVIPYYNGNRGMPMIMSNVYRKELLEVEGDKGGRYIVKNHQESIHKVYIDEEKPGMDIDTRGDLNYISNME